MMVNQDIAQRERVKGYAGWLREMGVCAIKTAEHLFTLSCVLQYACVALASWALDGPGGGLLSFGGAYWPLATEHSDPRWV